MDRIVHRGPDGYGIHSDEYVTLGFRRLSFIDLQDGSQPMYNEDESMVLVFNGEIYNYKQLREVLIEEGHVFKTMCDTEVLIHAYEQYGEDMLHKLRGMFAFVIYDKVKKELFAARDFFGIKPFYYSIINDNFLFGSEIKSFLEYPYFKKELNETALEYYLYFQYSADVETFFKGVYKLMPGHSLIFKDGQVTTKQYFKPVFNAESMSEDDAIKKIDSVVVDSVHAHRISDVEVGSFLSSGVDSSYVAACFGGSKTFTVGFSPKGVGNSGSDDNHYSEISYAEELSKEKGLDNYSKIIGDEEYWEVLPKVQYYMDEPLADPAAVALYFVSNLASGHVKGTMSGEGADEFFGGYNIYREPIDIAKYTNYVPMSIRRLLGSLAGMLPINIKGKNFLIRAGKTVEERFIGNANIFTPKEVNSLLKNSKNLKPQDITNPVYKQSAGYDDITKMQHLDTSLWLVGDILLKADKMSMANSLEVRVPFLDKEVFDVARRLPLNLRVNKNSTKYAFRKAANRHIPEKSANKKKLGFPVPIRVWLREDKYYSVVKTAFESADTSKYFNNAELIRLLDQHKSGQRDNSRKIWTVYMFLVWYKEFFSTEEKNKGEYI